MTNRAERSTIHANARCFDLVRKGRLSYSDRLMKQMRNYSTPQSALNLEITKLAIVECVVAVLLYGGAGIYLGSFRYLAVAVVFAPLMLFRTEESATWGLTAYSKFVHRTLGYSPEWLGIIAFLLVVPLVGPAIRIVSTVFWAVRHPLYTLKETPNNWLRQTVCTDLAHVPEIVPLDAVSGPELKLPTFTRYVKLLRKDLVLDKLFTVVLFLPFLVVGWVPSLLYRVSFKATSLVYAPLIFVTRVTVQNRLSLEARLERFTEGELEKVRRGLSWIILGSLIAKVALLLAFIDRASFEAKFPSARIATTFVVPDHWPWWQITLTIDALMTFFLFFFADAALKWLKAERVWREDVVLNVVTSASFLRAVLSIITISYFFYVALLAAFPSVISRLSLS